MAHSYYSPRRVRRHSVSDVPVRTTTDEELTGDLEQSIFIFPSSARANGARIDADPPSPLSIPSDASFPTLSPATESASRGRRISNASGLSQWTFSNSMRSVSVDTSSRSPLVEVWEMSDDAMENEDTTGRAPAPMNFAAQQQQRQSRLPLYTRPYSSQFVFSDGRFHLRARRESAISSVPSVNGASPTGTAETPASKHAATSHLPLLAFFASLLSIDDSTLHVLKTRASDDHTSPLFPDGRLYHADDALLDAMYNEKRAIFAESPIPSLKTGMEIVADPSATPSSVFSLPVPLPVPPLPFSYFIKLMKDVYNSNAPQKVRLAARAT